jgi:hypothetical protein
MKRWTSLALRAALVVGTGYAAAQEAQTIKLKDLAAGESAQVERTETVKVANLVVDAKGEKSRDTTSTTVETLVFKETVLQRDGRKPPTKLEREYTKAQFTAGGAAKDLPYQGKTVVIEKQGDKYTFTMKGGAELPAADAQLLDKEFNRHTDSRVENERKLLPKDAVKVNEAWTLDMAAVLKPLEKGGEMSFDAAKASGTGKLTKVYKKDDKTFGEMHYLLKTPLLTLGKDKEKLELLDGSYANFDVSLDVCIDGSMLSEVRGVKKELQAKARVPLPTGGTGDWTLTVTSEVREVRKELAKK